MFGLSGFELFLILLFGFLIVGPDKLPAIAQTVGRAIAKFRSAQEEMNKVVKTEIYDPMSKDPVKNPLDAIDKENKEKVEKKESYADRKAKYDKERADKKKREAAAQAARDTRAEVTAEQEAAKKAEDDGMPNQTSANAAEVHKRIMDARQEATEKAASDVASERQAERDLADELLGVKKVPAKTAQPAENENASSTNEVKES